MGNRLAGRVAIVTGAGRGFGRAHALALAAEGAAVVVNDLGGAVDGTGKDASAADQVVAEIEAAGGRAVASHHDVADWNQAGELVGTAVERFGRLDTLVNNAGIVRDRTLANLQEYEWDAVMRVHLKGHAACTHHAVAHWRALHKSGTPVDASVVMTSSAAGFAGSFGQAAYATAKLGVVALARSVVVEAGGFGVRANSISPSGRTRISLTSPGAETELAPPDDGFDLHDPSNVAPLVVWLALPGSTVTGQVFHLGGGRLVVSEMPPIRHVVDLGRRWQLDDFDSELAGRLAAEPSLEAWFGSALADDRS